jgi:hypothetical protein
MEGRRTQITLTARQHAYLADMSAWSGLPMAELIRRAIDQTYRKQSRPKKRGLYVTGGFHRELDAAKIGRRFVPPKPRLYDDIV